jgi:EKC/KEOPS complex subunit CGI121/TPRKB
VALLCGTFLRIRLTDVLEQIAEAYRRWGVSPTTKDLIVIKVRHPHDQASPAPPFTSQQDVWKHLEQNVQGRKVSFTDEELARSTDWTKVRKYYKLGGAKGMEKLKDDKARLEEAETLIIGAMALRGL